MRGTLVAIVLGLSIVVVAAATAPILRVGPFSTAQPGGPFPSGWKPLTFEKIDRHTRYTLVRDEDGTVVVKAESHGSSSGLTRELSIDPREYPIVEWRWKVENLIEKADVTSKAGDDYPARLYITFAYDPRKVGWWERAQFELIKLAYGRYPPLGAINYIWERRTPAGSIVPNPYTDRVQMIVVRSGGQHLNQWLTERRNVYQDYVNAFGEPPSRISGVAIMTDTDNTGESAVAYYGDIVFKQAAN
ncbi:MAG: DUF3047 domain-containing protein [Nitrospirae bacterium]|nr:MAG: DUF3047 domain-containing protein [Nitrospirota bacterium]